MIATAVLLGAVDASSAANPQHPARTARRVAPAPIQGNWCLYYRAGGANCQFGDFQSCMYAASGAGGGLCERLRKTSLQAETLMVRSLPNRLAMALLQLAESGASEGNPKVAVTQNDLASVIGMSRESTNKQLRIWAANNLVRLKRGGIVIMCLDALISIAEGHDMVMWSLQPRASYT